MNGINSLKAQTPQLKAVQKPEEKTSQENKNSIKTSTKVMIGAGLAVLAATGIYIATRGKVKATVENIKAPVEQIMERTLANGKKVTREVVKAEDGTEKTILKLFDKDGNFVYQKEKQIERSVNSANGKKYITKTEKYTSDSGEFVALNGGDIQFINEGERVTNTYYDVSGNKLFETKYNDMGMDKGYRSKSKIRTAYNKDGSEVSSVTHMEWENGNLNTRTERRRWHQLDLIKTNFTSKGTPAKGNKDLCRG